jgi:hypothetical protein
MVHSLGDSRFGALGRAGARVAAVRAATAGSYDRASTMTAGYAIPAST